MSAGQGTPLTVKTTMKNMASQDGHATVIGIEEDPGSAGKSEADDLVRFLAGYQIHRFRPRRRSSPLGAARCPGGGPAT
jgi:phage terminase large subunit-like protein